METGFCFDKQNEGNYQQRKADNEMLFSFSYFYCLTRANADMLRQGNSLLSSKNRNSGANHTEDNMTGVRECSCRYLIQSTELTTTDRLKPWSLLEMEEQEW